MDRQIASIHPAQHSMAELPAFSVKEVGFFEGAEKLLEMWFDFPQHEEKGLRIIAKYYLMNNL